MYMYTLAQGWFQDSRTVQGVPWFAVAIDPLVLAYWGKMMSFNACWSLL